MIIIIATASQPAKRYSSYVGLAGWTEVHNTTVTGFNRKSANVAASEHTAATLVFLFMQLMKIGTKCRPRYLITITIIVVVVVNDLIID